MWYSGCYVLDCVSEYWWGSLALYRIFGTYRRKFYSKSGYCTLALNIQRTNNEMLSRLILNGVAENVSLKHRLLRGVTSCRTTFFVDFACHFMWSGDSFVPFHSIRVLGSGGL